MTCPACGKSNPEGESRCVHCLRPLQPAPAAAPPNAAPLPPISFNPQSGAPLPNRGSLAGHRPPPGPPQNSTQNLGYPVVCRVCGNTIYGGQQKCARCKVPAGMCVDPNDPSGSNFLVIDPEIVAAHDPRRRR